MNEVTPVYASHAGLRELRQIQTADRIELLGGYPFSIRAGLAGKGVTNRQLR